MDYNKIVAILKKDFIESGGCDTCFKLCYLVNALDGFYFDTVCQFGNIDLMIEFIGMGQDITQDNHYPLYICAENKFDDCVKLLLANGEDLENIKHTTNYEYYKSLYHYI